MYKYLVLVLTLLFTGCSTYNKMNVVSPNVLLDNSQYEIVGDIEGQATYTQYLFGRISFDQDYYKNELLLTEAGVKLDDSGYIPNLTTDAKRNIYQRADYYKSEDIVYPETISSPEQMAVYDAVMNSEVDFMMFPKYSYHVRGMGIFYKKMWIKVEGKGVNLIDKE